MQRLSFLTPEFFQGICDQLSQATGHCVSVGGPEGTIIASSERGRVGDYHYATVQMMTAGVDSFPIDAEMAKANTGMREGYGLPLEYKGEKIAVIGVAAPIEEAKKIAEIARICANTILHDTGRELELKEQLEVEVKKRTQELELEIEERQKAEAELAQSEKRMRDIASASSDWFWETDNQGRFVYFSEGLYKTFGFKKEDMIGKTREDLFQGKVVNVDEKAWQEVTDKQNRGEVFRAFNYEVMMPDGNRVIFETSGIPVYEDGELVGYRGTGADVTQRFIMEESLKQAEKMASLGEMVAGVAHEVNTPIGICVTVASHLKTELSALEERYQSGKMSRNHLESFLAETGAEYEIMLSNLKRAADLVRSFKQVAVDQSSEKVRKFNFKDYINEVLISLRPKLKKGTYELRVNSPDVVIVSSRPDVFAHIITNLVMNSLIHGFDELASGQIEISVFMPEENNRNLRLVYKDDGKGMTKETLNKIYEPFYTTKRGIGSGLGMHIIYTLITEVLMGRITCHSEPGQGVWFEIEIPEETPSFTLHTESENSL